jgi:hypothetical protein
MNRSIVKLVEDHETLQIRIVLGKDDVQAYAEQIQSDSELMAQLPRLTTVNIHDIFPVHLAKDVNGPTLGFHKYWYQSLKASLAL